MHAPTMVISRTVDDDFRGCRSRTRTWRSRLNDEPTRVLLLHKGNIRSFCDGQPHGDPPPLAFFILLCCEEGLRIPDRRLLACAHMGA